MKTYNDFNYSTQSVVNKQILDSLNSGDILSVSLKIKATHAGKVNGNDVFYTPRSMRNGASTLTVPFKKHLQDLHYGDAVGEINDAYYKDYTEKYSEEIQKIALKIDQAKSAKELVTAVKELVKHEDYTSKLYKGLGVIQVSAELYDEALIEAIATGSNKGKVSIGGNSRQVYCSVCAELFKKNHRHVKGKTYNGEDCYAIYDDMALDHIGFVPDPADDKTETVIVAGIQDSLYEDDISVSIEHIKIQDNLQGKQKIMKIEDLKKLLKEDTNYLVDLVDGLTDQQKEVLATKYADGLKNLRASSYLFTEEKLLAVKTKEQVALAKLALTQVEDSAEKATLLDMLKVIEEKFFKEDEDSLAFLLATEVPEKTTETVAKDIVDGTNTPLESQDVKVEKTIEPFLSEEALSAILTEVTTAIAKAMAPVQEEQAKIQDSLQYSSLLNRNKQLELDIEAVDAKNVELTNKYKDSIINQILLHKGLTAEDEYAQTLATRDLDTLAVLLDDTKFDLSRLAKTQTTEVATVNTEVAKQVDLEKAPIKDSLEGDEKTKVLDSTQKGKDIDKATFIKAHGVAQYLKTFKNN